MSFSILWELGIHSEAILFWAGFNTFASMINLWLWKKTSFANDYSAILIKNSSLPTAFMSYSLFLFLYYFSRFFNCVNPEWFFWSTFIIFSILMILEAVKLINRVSKSSRLQKTESLATRLLLILIGLMFGITHLLLAGSASAIMLLNWRQLLLVSLKIKSFSPFVVQYFSLATAFVEKICFGGGFFVQLKEFAINILLPILTQVLTGALTAVIAGTFGDLVKRLEKSN